MLAQIKSDYPKDVRFIYRHFPLLRDGEGNLFHDKSGLAVQAAESAGLQDKFWEMHDLIFENQPLWAVLTPEEFDTWALEQAAILELDVGQFALDYASADIAQIAENSFLNGFEIGLQGTPTLMVDGDIIGSQFFAPEALNAILKHFLIPMGRMVEKQFSECPEITID
ncbi:MAG: DsbA family protein, partial [Chloroflexota bacterium]